MCIDKVSFDLPVSSTIYYTISYSNLPKDFIYCVLIFKN